MKPFSNPAVRSVVIAGLNVLNSVFSGTLVFQMTTTTFRHEDGADLTVLVIDWGSFWRAESFWILAASVLASAVFLAVSKNDIRLDEEEERRRIYGLIEARHLEDLSKQAQEKIRKGEITGFTALCEFYGAKTRTHR